MAGAGSGPLAAIRRSRECIQRRRIPCTPPCLGLRSRMTVSKTKSERHKRFLEGGFFPREMPPPFVSSDIAAHRMAIEKALEALP